MKGGFYDRKIFYNGKVLVFPFWTYSYRIFRVPSKICRRRSYPFLQTMWKNVYKGKQDMTVYDTHRKRDPFADIGAQDFAEYRKWKCEADGEGCLGLGSQRHHALIRRDRRFPWLNVLINYQLVCRVCHTETGYADSKENRDRFYEIQCERYGKDVVDNWIDNCRSK